MTVPPEASNKAYNKRPTIANDSLVITTMYRLFSHVPANARFETVLRLWL